MNLAKLREPFSETDVEWRIQRSGFKSGKPWALVLAYVTNRAIQQRLDEVCGPENWQNKYDPAPSGEGVLCGIGIKLGDWVWKWDGAENTQFEAVKGGLSGSMKRAAVQWGIGRYLYDLEAGFAEFCDDGRYRDKVKDESTGQEKWLKWNPPRLPTWAVTGAALPEREPERESEGAAGDNGKKAPGPALLSVRKQYGKALREAVQMLNISPVVRKNLCRKSRGYDAAATAEALRLLREHCAAREEAILDANTAQGKKPAADKAPLDAALKIFGATLEKRNAPPQGELSLTEKGITNHE